MDRVKSPPTNHHVVDYLCLSVFICGSKFLLSQAKAEMSGCYLAEQSATCFATGANRKGGPNMRLSLATLTFEPDREAIDSLIENWSWRLPEHWTSVMFSILGDAFLQDGSGRICWFNTGTGTFAEAAADRAAFTAALGGDQGQMWLMPPLVERRREAGKVAAIGECYSFKIFPIFSQRTYEPDNIWVVSAKEHFGLSGDLHRQVRICRIAPQVRTIIGSPPTPSQV